jgi:hypothetical protein
MPEPEKQPAMQWYPKDWFGDDGVQALDYETRGIWFEMLMRMWVGEERGKLVLNGKPMAKEALARLLSISEDKLRQTIDKLMAYGVASMEQDTGKIYSRRMVRYKSLTEMRSDAGKKGAHSKWHGKTKNGDGKGMRIHGPASATAVAEGAAAALEQRGSATPGAVAKTENKIKETEEEIPERKWPEEIHISPEFWISELEKRTACEKISEEIQRAVHANGFADDSFVISMKANLAANLKGRPAAARLIAEHMKSLFESPAYAEAHEEELCQNP